MLARTTVTVRAMLDRLRNERQFLRHHRLHKLAGLRLRALEAEAVAGAVAAEEVARADLCHRGNDLGNQRLVHRKTGGLLVSTAVFLATTMTM